MMAINEEINTASLDAFYKRHILRRDKGDAAMKKKNFNFNELDEKKKFEKIFFRHFCARLYFLVPIFGLEFTRGVEKGISKFHFACVQWSDFNEPLFRLSSQFN